MIIKSNASFQALFIFLQFLKPKEVAGLRPCSTSHCEMLDEGDKYLELTSDAKSSEVGAETPTVADAKPSVTTQP